MSHSRIQERIFARIAFGTGDTERRSSGSPTGSPIGSTGCGACLSIARRRAWVLEMIGIDWGTASSSVGYVSADNARLLPVSADGETRLPSTAFVPRTPSFDAPTDELGLARVLTPELLRRGRMTFGHAATASMLEGDDGFYVKSPKSFLGAELRERQVLNFTALVARMLGELLDQAALALGRRPESAVIGRPVRYHGTRGDVGDRQAIEIMERAAHLAGLTQVRFLIEPVAAAFAYETNLRRERLVLIVDVGGGTTDLTLVRLGPDRARIEPLTCSVRRAIGSVVRISTHGSPFAPSRPCSAASPCSKAVCLCRTTTSCTSALLHT